MSPTCHFHHRHFLSYKNSMVNCHVEYFNIKRLCRISMGIRSHSAHQRTTPSLILAKLAKDSILVTFNSTLKTSLKDGSKLPCSISAAFFQSLSKSFSMQIQSRFDWLKSTTPSIEALLKLIR